MPAEHHHIDEFFRAKENESTVPPSLQEEHWQQMEQMLAEPQRPVAKIRTGRTTLLWQAAAVTLLAVTAFLWVHRNNTGTSNTTAAVATGHNGAPALSPDESNSLRRPSKKVVAGSKESSASTASSSTISSVKISSRKHAVHQVPSSKQMAVVHTKSANSSNNKIINKNTNDKTALVTGTAAATTPPVPDASLAYNNFFASLRQPDQEFRIDASRDTTVRCAQGTTIFIPANSFVTQLGAPVQHMVIVSVREAYSFADIVADRLTTLSGEKELQTAGMIRILASAGAEPLDLRPGGDLRLQMPTPRIDTRMQLFEGQTVDAADSSTADGTVVDWLPIGQQQTFYKEWLKNVMVLNLTNNTYDIRYRHPNNPEKMYSVASYLIHWDCPYSTAYIQQKLQEKYGRYYDRIVVKRERRPWFRKNRQHITGQEWYDSRFVGDTVSMPIAMAMRRHFITRDDSLAYEAKWKADMEQAMKQRQYEAPIFNLAGDYLFNVKKLGWINCDAFMDRTRDQLTEMLVSTDQRMDKQYSHTILIFKRKKAVLPGYWDAAGNIQFRNIGKGEPVSIICIGMRDGKAYAGIREMTTGEARKVEVKITEVTPEQLKEKLAQLGSVNRS